MNCRDANELLERMIFEEVPLDAGLKQHIAACPSCAQAFRDALKAREVMSVLRRSVPLLDNPDEITDNIMFAVQQGPEKTAFVPLLFQRLLAAASIALFVLFGYEQYEVVKKVSALETKLSETRIESRYSDPQRLAMTFDINRAGVSFSEIMSFVSREKGTRIQSVSSLETNKKRNIK